MNKKKKKKGEMRASVPTAAGGNPPRWAEQQLRSSSGARSRPIAAGSGRSLLLLAHHRNKRPSRCASDAIPALPSSRCFPGGWALPGSHPALPLLEWFFGGNPPTAACGCWAVWVRVVCRVGMGLGEKPGVWEGVGGWVLLEVELGEIANICN